MHSRRASFRTAVGAHSISHFAFWAMRTDDELDLERVRSTLTSLRAYCLGVGAVIYPPVEASKPTTYRVRKLPELSIDRALGKMAQRIS
jgi:hypothetical protein